MILSCFFMAPLTPCPVPVPCPKPLLLCRDISSSSSAILFSLMSFSNAKTFLSASSYNNSIRFIPFHFNSFYNDHDKVVLDNTSKYERTKLCNRGCSASHYEAWKSTQNHILNQIDNVKHTVCPSPSSLLSYTLCYTINSKGTYFTYTHSYASRSVAAVTCAMALCSSTCSLSDAPGLPPPPLDAFLDGDSPLPVPLPLYGIGESPTDLLSVAFKLRERSWVRSDVPLPLPSSPSPSPSPRIISFESESVSPDELALQ